MEQRESEEAAASRGRVDLDGILAQDVRAVARSEGDTTENKIQMMVSIGLAAFENILCALERAGEIHRSGDRVTWCGE